jgi:hypothetical protein
MRFSKDDCIKSLQKAAEEMGQPLTVEDYRESGYSPSDRTIHDRFGSWPEALQEAGLMSVKHGKNGIFEPLVLHQDEEGYEYFGSKWEGKNEELKLHRLLAVAEYGFDKVAGKVVHHKNGIPWDNRADNIEVLTRSEHGKIHSPNREFIRDNKGRIKSW